MYEKENFSLVAFEKNYEDFKPQKQRTVREFLIWSQLVSFFLSENNVSWN